MRLIVARDGGAVSRAVFSEGKFTVTQARAGDPVATLTLTGPSYADVCDGASAAAQAQAQARAPAVGRRARDASAPPGATPRPRCAARAG